MNKIYVYWWALNERGGVDNYGDILAPFLAEKLSGKKVVKVSHPMDKIYRWFIKHYVTVGSIINVASNNSIVWGSGIIKKDQNVRAAKFLAVRGPRTRMRLIELGYQVPEVYGDPAILLPMFVPNQTNKKFEIGIIPHYVDYENINNKFQSDPNVKVINLMTDDVVKTTKEILECKQIISSSLHGVIVSHSYGIPALWVKFSNNLAGDNTKFYDYFESVKLNYKKEIFIPFENLKQNLLINLLGDNQSILLPTNEMIELRQKDLILSCPFNNVLKNNT